MRHRLLVLLVMLPVWLAALPGEEHTQQDAEQTSADAPEVCVASGHACDPDLDSCCAEKQRCSSEDDGLTYRCGPRG